MTARDDDRSARQISRSKRRKAGDRSGELARTLMLMSAPVLKRLELDEDMRAAIDRARAVTSLVARRRAERTLAGDLRKFDLVELEEELAKVQQSSNTDARELHLAEQWRTRLLEEGIAAAATLPGGDDAELPRLLDAAKREKTTGRPPGAQRALFRHIVMLLKTPKPAD